jgi:hypothetical protein
MTTELRRILAARDVLIAALDHDDTRGVAASIALTVVTLALNRDPAQLPDEEAAEHIVNSYTDTEHIPNWRGMVADLQGLAR